MTTKMQRDLKLEMSKFDYDQANKALQMFLTNFGQTHKWAKYRREGCFCDDPEENKKFIEEIENNSGQFKNKIRNYEDAKNIYDSLKEKVRI